MNKEVTHDLSKSVSEYLTEIHTIVDIDDTISEALRKIREQGVVDKIVYFYAIDKNKELKGVVPTRRLLLSDPNTPIRDIVQYSVIRLSVHQTLQESLEVFARHRLLAIPVVDDEGKLLGAIDVEMYVEESFDVADSRHRRDVFQMLGMTLEEGKKASIFRSYRLRMPWLFCNMFSGFLCAIISRVNEEVLGKFLLLAMFIPLVLTLSESVSMQSMTQSMQFLRRPRMTFRYAFLRALREWKIVGLVGFSCGLIVGLISLFWGEGFMPSLTIATSICSSIIVSAGIGILIPIFLHARKLDPKVAAGPVVLMFADTLTTLFYLTIASWWLL